MDDQPSELDQRQTSPAAPVVLTPVPIVQGQGQKQVVVLTPQSATGRKRRRLLMLGGLGILLVLGVGLWYWSNGTVTHLYKTLPVDRGPITSLITATGAVNPVISVQVGSQVSGKIARIYADFNSVVREGQVLASIDQKPYQAKVSQAKAALKSALANLAKARNMVAQRKLELDRIATCAPSSLSRNPTWTWLGPAIATRKRRWISRRLRSTRRRPRWPRRSWISGTRPSFRR